MSSKSKAKAIADLLMANASSWMGWGEIMAGLGIDLSMVPRKSLAGLMEPYMTYLPHVYAELDERGRFLLRDGIALKARFKIATTDPEDRADVESRLMSLKKRERGISNRIEKRIENLKDEKILPGSWSPALNA